MAWVKVSDVLRDIDKDILNPKRLLIMTLLYTVGSMRLSELRQALGISWGDLDSNIRRLVEKGYVSLSRSLGKVRVLEIHAKLTEKGVREYEKLVAYLRDLLPNARSE